MMSMPLAAIAPALARRVGTWACGLLALLACALALLAGTATAGQQPQAGLSDHAKLMADATAPAMGQAALKPDMDPDAAALEQALAEAVSLADAMADSLVPVDPFDPQGMATVAYDPSRHCCLPGDTDEDSFDRDLALLPAVAGVAADPLRVSAVEFQHWPRRVMPPPQRPPRPRA